MALLELEEVRAGYGPTSVLHGISLEVPDGGVVSLLGANGAGKTTTLRAITGGVRWTGDIRFRGRSLRRMSTEEIVRRGIAHVPEGRGICTELTVDENLKLGSHLRKDGAAVHKDYDRVFEYFPVLNERRWLSASTLSGGEQQMLAVARALLMKPRLMLLDEPSLGLAPLVVRSIFEIIRTINQTDHVAVLLVEQNARVAAASCTRGSSPRRGAARVRTRGCRSPGGGRPSSGPGRFFSGGPPRPCSHPLSRRTPSTPAPLLNPPSPPACPPSGGWC